MERVTHLGENGHYYMTGDGIYGVWSVPEKYAGDDVDTIGKIEDIIGDDYDLDRLRELVEADRENRCVIFEKGYGIVSTYDQDDDGFVIRTVSGVAPKSDPVVAHFIRRDDSTNEDRVN